MLRLVGVLRRENKGVVTARFVGVILRWKLRG